MKSYKQFLKRDSAQKNTFLTGSVNIMYTLNGREIQEGKGTCLSVGINLARFLSKKIVLGLVFDVKLEQGFWVASPSSKYQTDFNKAFQIHSISSSDSAKANIVSEWVNKTVDPNAQYPSNIVIQGSKFFEYGVMYSPFPKDYGGIQIKIQRGRYLFPIGGIYGDKKINGVSMDYAYIQLPNNYRVELTFKPLLLFRKSVSTAIANSKLKVLNYALISFFYERLSFKDADIQGFKFDQFLAPWFINKYAIDEHFGFKLSIGIF